MHHHPPVPHRVVTRPELRPAALDPDADASRATLPSSDPSDHWSDNPPHDPGPTATTHTTVCEEPGYPASDNETTRRRLVDAGRRAFASTGVERASLLGICRATGQRNRAAVHYHFGSRAEFVVAILDEYGNRWRQREDELLLGLPADDAAAVRRIVEAMVRPPVELSREQPGRDHVIIVDELLSASTASLTAEVRGALGHARHERALELLRARLPQQSPTDRHRTNLAVSFVRRAILVRTRRPDRDDPTGVDHDDDFVRLMVGMALTIIPSASSGTLESDPRVP